MYVASMTMRSWSRPVILLISGLGTATEGFQQDAAATLPASEGGRRLFDTHAVVRLFEENGWPLPLLHSLKSQPRASF